LIPYDVLHLRYKAFIRCCMTKPGRRIRCRFNHLRKLGVPVFRGDFGGCYGS
jgi:hypothetical protein